MAQITSSGIGSGLDIGSLITQLVAAERAPTENRLNRREARVQAQLSAFGSLRSALDGFQASLNKLQDANTFLKRSATSSDKSVFTAAAGTSATPGTFSVQVEALAAQHKIGSQAFADAGTAVGTGTLTMTVNGQSFSLDIVSDDGGDTLAGIRDAINGAADNVGVTATIVNDQDGAHLVLTSDETGLANEMTVAVTTDGSDTGDLSVLAFDPNAASNPMSEIAAATDARIIVDGFIQTSANNTFENVLDDVAFTARSADPGVVHTLEIGLDKSAVRSAVEGFVTAFNSLRSKLNELTAYDAETGRAGLLQGDSLAIRIASQLRRELSQAVEGVNADVDTLAELGITTNVQTGALEISANKLNDALDNHFAELSTLFAGDDGFAVRLDAVVDAYTRSGGFLDNRTDGLQSQIDRITDQREALNRRLAVIEQRYIQQFTALDTLLGELNNTSNFLNQQLQNLPKPNSGNR